MIGSFLTALAAIPQIIGFVEMFASAVTFWWVQRQTTKTLQAIADAAAYSARAQNEDDRYKAAALWQIALSKPRITP